MKRATKTVITAMALVGMTIATEEFPEVTGLIGKPDATSNEKVFVSMVEHLLTQTMSNMTEPVSQNSTVVVIDNASAPMNETSNSNSTVVIEDHQVPVYDNTSAPMN